MLQGNIVQLEGMSLEEYARKLFHQPCTFVRSVPALEHLPPLTLPEIAFAGRSNVGKSSLINALTNRNGLAHASNTPGRTQQLNFFNLADTLFLVDLPGYGYAEAPKAVIETWTRLIRDYLKGRSSLKRVFVLVDSRHGLKPNDIKIMDLLDLCAVSYQLVLTKTDKISMQEHGKVLAQTHEIATKHPAAYPQILSTSSEKKTGLDEVRTAAASLIAVQAVEDNNGN